jgi:hypothetical protein
VTPAREAWLMVLLCVLGAGAACMLGNAVACSPTTPKIEAGTWVPAVVTPGFDAAVP